MSEEFKIREAIHLVWYNLPTGMSTFSQCSNVGCEESARGGGICLKCAESQLADLTSKESAREFAEAALNIRKLEANMVDEHGDF